MIVHIKDTLLTTNIHFWFSVRETFRGKTIGRCILKQKAIVSIFLSIVFYFEGQKSFSGASLPRKPEFERPVHMSD